MSRGRPRGPAFILFEGTCGVGKTSLARAVAAELAAEDVVTLLQDRTYGPVAPLEDAGTLDDATNAALLHGILHEIARHVAAHKVVLVDTLHLTQRVRPGVLGDSSFRAIDMALSELRATICFLEAPRETIFERAIVRRRGTGFLRYAQKFSRDEQGLADYFFEEQTRMKGLLHTLSRLPSVLLSAELSPEVLCDYVLTLIRA